MSDVTLITLPDISVQVGFSSGAPIDGGGLLILDDATYGQLDTGELSDSIDWTDVTDLAKTFQITQPMTRQMGPLWNFQGGTASIVFDNSDGSLDPNNLDGPYVVDGVSQVHPMNPIRIVASFDGETYSLFNGFVNNWNPAAISSYTTYTEINVDCSDAFYVFAGMFLPQIASTGAGDESGARIQWLLNQAGWYYSNDWQQIDAGTVQLQATTLNDYVLNLLQDVATAEIAQLYVDGNGAVIFRDRTSIVTDDRSANVQAVFGDSPGTSHDAGTELDVAVINRADDDTTIANDIQATVINGTTQEVKDDTSIAKYLFARTYQESSLTLQTDADALTWAQWVLYVAANEENRFDSIQIDPQADPVNLWPQVLGRLMGDRIQVWCRPPALSDPIDKNCFITGIQHNFDATTSIWSTLWSLQDASKYGSFFILDNATLGQLDENALAF